MRWWFKPNSAEIEPKVNPVAISSVVYVRSLIGMRNAVELGQTPTNLVAILTTKSTAMIPAPETSSGAEISVPARRKKNGVRNAKAIVRIRSMITRSCMNTPAEEAQGRRYPHLALQCPRRTGISFQWHSRGGPSVHPTGHACDIRQTELCQLITGTSKI